MIAYLKGTIQDKKPDAVILDVNGVGYLVHIPLSTFYKVPAAGAGMDLHVYTHVREDQLALFGFATGMELDIFRALVTVPGFGPKKALTVLSGMEAETLIQCLTTGDVVTLSSIPGIGRKTAERLIYELKEKLHKYIETPIPAAAGSATIPAATADDLLSALINLGYPKAQAEKAVAQAARQLPDGSFESLLKQALKQMLAR